MRFEDMAKYLRDTYGENWFELEPETVMMDLDDFSEETADQIMCLRVMEGDPNKFCQDTRFFLHSCELINGMIPNFDNFPMPSSLELAYGIVVYSRLFPGYEPDYDISKTVGFLLKEEGYSEPVWPFEFVNPGDLTKGQSKAQTDDKQKAIKLYIKYMDKMDD